MNPPLHILGRFGDPHSGAELQVLELARRLQGRRPVRLWSDVAPHPVFVRQGVRHVRPFDRQIPNGGSLLLGSIYTDSALWLRHAKLDAVVVHYNVTDHEGLFEKIAEVRAATGLEPQLSFVSRPLQMAVNLPGFVEPSWIDLTEFLAIPRSSSIRLHKAAIETGQRFTVGRISRDFLGKHHDLDASLYRMLVQRGVRVRVMGGTCLTEQLAGVEGVELLPAGAMPAAEFLTGIDLFFYRTGIFSEAYGRVVLEAMAAGLPVVVGAQGGYAEAVQHGVSGLFVRSQEEAFDAITRLAGDAAAGATLGSQARSRAEELHGALSGSGLLDFYCEV